MTRTEKETKTMAMALEDSLTEGGATDPLDAGVECPHCAMFVSRALMDRLPAAGDDAAWAVRAAEHGSGCEYIATRAQQQDAR